MKHPSQKIAREYFLAALPLFFLQVVFGLLASVKYVWGYDPLLNVAPFNIARTIHLNLLVFWLLLALMGATYYMVADELDTDIYSVRLARLQLWILLVSGVAAIIGYFFHWSFGMPFLEQPTLIKVAIVVAALIFLYNIAMTMFTNHHILTRTTATLMGGMVMLSVMFLFGIPFMGNLSTQYYFWWWVIHLWVEGAWELIAASLVAWSLIKLTGVSRRTVEGWVFAEVALVLLTGIIGTGHHYYWIGTPHYWLVWGAVFSAAEPVPIVMMLVDAVRDLLKARTLPIVNTLALAWLGASAFVHFMGAGVWGFGQTLPQINRWTHGTQITASHGHFAFWGAYGMLAIALMYGILPEISGRKPNGKQALSFAAFMTLNFSMIFMVMALLIAGIVQVYLQRVMGMDFLEVQNHLRVWFEVRLVAGCLFTVGSVLLLWDLFRLAARQPAAEAAAQPVPVPAA
ncbi:MAG: nitric-oxide reductase [Acidobacteria bacterium]|nr:MAG: nitric-oxide reductase [Acidobacteriota bacterium]PYV23772.1 MAG: nitric-oxide reductase [Acidobacteriota bacterium]